MARRGIVLWILGALAGVAAMAWAGLTGFAWSDYDTEAAPAFKALTDGDVGLFLALSPSYGGSLVLRAPFAWLTGALGGGELAVYRAVSVPCLVAAGALGVVLVRRLRARAWTVWACALVLGLCVANPVTLRALEIGHPEELLGAVLCVAAVLAASGGRGVLAGVLLGLAVATKLWAVLAIGPVLLALPDRRVRTLLVAGGVGGAVLAPLLLSGGAATIVTGAGQTGSTIFQPWQVLWLLGDVAGPVIGGDGLPKPDGWRTPPAWLSPVSHPLIAALVVPLSVLWWRRRPGVAGEGLLALLALLMLLRCVLDPWNFVYYALPFILALLAWEVLERDRVPVLALCATVLTWATWEWIAPAVAPDVQFALYMAWTLPLAGHLAHVCFGRPRTAPAGRPAALRAVGAGPAGRAAAGTG